MGSISLNRSDYSLYSFLRLVGCAYFRLHASVFEHTSPVALYNSISSTGDIWDTHTKWLDLIRNGVWLRADSEANNVPTAEALRFHWYRCLWVLGLWNSSTNNEIQLPGMHNALNYTWRCKSHRKHNTIWVFLGPFAKLDQTQKYFTQFALMKCYIIPADWVANVILDQIFFCWCYTRFNLNIQNTHTPSGVA